MIFIQNGLIFQGLKIKERRQLTLTYATAKSTVTPHTVAFNGKAKMSKCHTSYKLRY